MSYWHAVIALGFIILGAMWIYELWDILNERIESNGSICQCSAAKSDARATSTDEARAMGHWDAKASRSTQDHAPRRGAGIKSNASGSARSSQALVKPLQNKEGVTQ